MSEGIRILYREAHDSDLSYVFDSWLKEYRVAPMCTHLDADVYFPYYRKHLRDILDRSTVTMACNMDDPDQIYGYAVHRKIGSVRVLSWIYIKGPYRRLGVGRALFDRIGGADIVTHISRFYRTFYDHDEKQYKTRLPKQLVYSPFIDLFVKENA
jgi:GNAT superfamily N-acetyltransferase